MNDVWLDMRSHAELYVVGISLLRHKENYKHAINL